MLCDVFEPQLPLPVYEKYNDSSYYVSISNSDRSPKLDYIATVYNGIDSSEFTFNPDPDDYLLFFGRIHAEKGTHESIQIAKRLKKRLIISGLIQDQHYFDEKVAPFINDEDIVYVGNSGPEARNRLLGNAQVLLHPVSFEEPFGLSVVEAMFCGTPVVAFNRGSMPELILHGRTGFIVRDLEDAAEAVQNIDQINREACLEWVSSMFTREKMVEEYLDVYEKVLESSQCR